MHVYLYWESQGGPELKGVYASPEQPQKIIAKQLARVQRDGWEIVEHNEPNKLITRFDEMGGGVSAYWIEKVKVR